MRDRPDGAELLAEARRLLVEELAPGLEGEQRYRALMVGKAMGMAEREIEAGADAEVDEHEDLAGLLGETGNLEAMNRRLAEAIRAGRHDGDVSAYEILRRSVTARVLISNPRALSEDGGR